eukprot:CAMPEP_0197415838 /NCGR_PEP_ID=MMETSP1170-20131217/2274_1 /TAXON_ID=54406 /ORGANISM="Sarcinochrysis sp, Strain CCMP770" /LENGTH=131 /DNA_ID=CAMNT_0042942681 /DNA_START=69 /DNA_END=460 /DNA_ORIENTATION=-
MPIWASPTEAFLRAGGAGQLSSSSSTSMAKAQRSRCPATPPGGRLVRNKAQSSTGAETSSRGLFTDRWSLVAFTGGGGSTWRVALAGDSLVVTSLSDELSRVCRFLRRTIVAGMIMISASAPPKPSQATCR